MHAEIIDALKRDARLDTDQAMAHATAIDKTIERAQFVTVPILDSRFAALEARFAAIDARFAAVDARFVELKADMKVRLVYFAAAIITVNLANGPIGTALIATIKHIL